MIEEPIAKNEKPGATIGQPLPAFSISLPPLRAEARKYTATGCRKFATAQNTQRRAVAKFATPKTHSDGLSQNLQRSKNTATGCRKICNAQNTQRRAVADLQQLKTHSDGLSQNLQRSKYTATGCRRFATAQNIQRRAVADLYYIIMTSKTIIR